MALSPEEKEKRKLERKKERYEKQHMLINNIDHKYCNLHYIYFPDESPWIPATLGFFYNNIKNSIDYLSTRCKRCESKAAMRWKNNNREKVRKSNIKRNNKPEIKAEINRRMLLRREEGKIAEWQRSPSGKMSFKRSQKKRAVKNHIITICEWNDCKNYFDNSCAYCGLLQRDHWIKRKGVLVNYDLHKEHVDDKGSADLDNCIPSCQYCNSIKHTSTLDEFYNESNINFTQERYNKIIKWITEDYKLYIEKSNPKRAMNN